MLQASPALGGRRGGRGRACLAGGGVSIPAETLESGELMGVSVTEEISRQDSDDTLWNQKREDGLCSRKDSPAASGGWGEVAQRHHRRRRVSQKAELR